MRVRVLILSVLVLALGACLSPLEVPYGRFGTISVRTFDDGAAGYLMAPEAAFYDQTDLSYQPYPSDTCFVLDYAVPNNSNFTTARTLDAGEYLVTNVSGRTDSLAPVPGIAVRLYEAMAPFGFPFVPGDTLTVTVPGATNGFPAGTVRVRTAEAFTHGAIGVPAANEAIPLTWTAATSPGSQITFSLRYANSLSTGALNEQVFCSFVDDGSATIRAAYLDGWRTATNDLREIRVVRVRANEIEIDSRTRLALVSTYGLPLPEIDP